MYANKLIGLGLIVPLLVVGLIAAAPQPARADSDLGWLLGGLALGAILSGGHQYTYYAPPMIPEAYFYPGPGVYVLPESYPGARFWAPAGEDWHRRLVLAPVSRPHLWGSREIVTLGPESGPVFRQDRGRARRHRW